MADALDRAGVLATGESIARMQERSGAIAWPDGHVDAWDHVECAMALSACGLREPARRAYRWLRETQRADGSWPRSVEGGRVTDPAAESHHAAYVAVGAWHEYLVTGDERHGLAMWPRSGARWTGRWRCARRAARSAGSATRPARREATRCSPGARASTRACAARSRWPSWPTTRGRTGSSRRTSSGTWWPATRRRSRTRAGSPWTGTTRCSAARSAARTRAAGWLRPGTRSWSPGWASAA